MPCLRIAPIACALSLLVPARPQDPPTTNSPPKANLPPVKRITLKLDRTPLKEAERQLSEAAGFPIHDRSGRWGWGMEDDPTTVTIDLQDVPLVEAVLRFGDCAPGPIRLEYGALVKPAVWMFDAHLGRSFHEHFGFELVRLTERVSTDFSEESRTCGLTLVMLHQPDVKVGKYLSVTVLEATDDRGNDLRLKPASKTAPDYWIAVDVALPPKGATALTRLRGTLEIEVPGDGKNAARLAVPFDFKNVPLMRPK